MSVSSAGAAAAAVGAYATTLCMSAATAVPEGMPGADAGLVGTLQPHLARALAGRSDGARPLDGSLDELAAAWLPLRGTAPLDAHAPPRPSLLAAFALLAFVSLHAVCAHGSLFARTAVIASSLRESSRDAATAIAAVGWSVVFLLCLPLAGVIADDPGFAGKCFFVSAVAHSIDFETSLRLERTFESGDDATDDLEELEEGKRRA